MPQTESFNSSEEEAYSSISPSTSELTGSRSSNSRQSGSRLSRLQGGDFNLNPPVDNERFYNINDTNTAASQNSSRRRQHRKPKTQISDSSDSTIFNESETSDEVEKKSKTSSFIETVIENIRGISMIYFFGVSLLIILLTFFLKKDFFWTFYQQKTPHEGETVITFNEISFNCRNIGYSIAFLVFSIGILATLINYGILKIETYFNVKEDYLTILATLSNHLSFIFVLSILLIILVYEGYLNLQFAKDTALDCGHVINTLLFSTILLAIKSYFLKSVSLSFDHERYLKRVRGIIRDTYFLKLLKAIKRVRKKEQNGEIIMTVPVNDSVIGGNEFDQESFEGTFNNEQETFPSDEELQIDDGQQFDDRQQFDNRQQFDDRQQFDNRQQIHDRQQFDNRQQIHDEQQSDNRQQIHDEQQIVEELNQQQRAQENNQRSENYFVNNLTNNHYNTHTSQINENSSEENKSKHKPQKLHDHEIKKRVSQRDFSNLAYDEGKLMLKEKDLELLFFNLPVKNSRKNQLVFKKAFYKFNTRENNPNFRNKWKDKAGLYKKNLRISKLADLRQFFCCDRFFLLFLNVLKIRHLLKYSNEIDGRGDDSSGADFFEKQDRNFSNDDTIHNIDINDQNFNEISTDPTIQTNRKKPVIPFSDRWDSSTTWSDNFKIEQKMIEGRQLLNIPLTAGLIFKFLERRDLELYNLQTTIEQNNAAIDRVSNFLSVVIFLLALSIFLSISLNKTDKTIDMLSALFGTGFILNTTIKDAINSCVFVFCVQPYDIGDRIFITIDNKQENLVVSEINVLSTTFIKYDGLYVIIPNNILNTKSIMNIRRSPLISESFYVNVRFDTPIVKLNQLSHNISQFLRSNSNSYTEYYFFNYYLLEDCNKLTLRIYISYVESWQQYDRYLEKRSAFLAFLSQKMIELDIRYRPLVQPVILMNSDYSQNGPMTSETNNEQKIGSKYVTDRINRKNSN